MKLLSELADLDGVIVGGAEPATRESGDPLEVGDVWIDTSTPSEPEINLWTGSVWEPTAAREHTHVEDDVTDLTHRQWIGPWTLDNAGAP